MVNKILHSVSNRAGGFAELSFPASATFTPCPETPDSLRVRQLLGVDRRSDDYHLIAVLAAIEAYPNIFYMFADPERTYRIEDFTTPAPIVSGAVLVDDQHGPAQVKLVATEAPVPDYVALTWLAATTGAVTYGSRREAVAVTVVGGTVYPAWPADLGLSGGLTAAWDADTRIEIRARPVRFPYAVLAAALRASEAKNSLLRAHGLVEAFHLAREPANQVALVALALGLSNSSVYG